MESLKAKVRIKNSENVAKKLRTKGYVPGIIYGKSLNNILFEVGDLELNSFVKKNGEHGTLEIDIEGQQYKTLIKEIQRHPVNKNILHIDLEDLSSVKKVVTEVPIHFLGENELKNNGNIMQKEKTNIKVECNSTDIPKYINVDVSKLKQGDIYKVADVELAKEISIMDDINSAIVSITHSNTFVTENMSSKEDENVSKENNKKDSEEEK